ncbi:MAG: hypothetical protein MJ252_09825 [archaeon]|nr:hypothetical protein [archaeon]
MEEEQKEQKEQIEPSSKYNIYLANENFKMVPEVSFFGNDVKGVGVHSLKFNYNDKYVAAGYRDGRIRVYSMLNRKPDGKPDFELDCNDGNENRTLVQVMKWRPKIEGRTNNILMAACRDTIFEFHVTSNKLIYRKQFTDNEIFSMDFSIDGSDYALGFKDGSIRVYDGVEKKEKLKLGGFVRNKNNSFLLG